MKTDSITLFSNLLVTAAIIVASSPTFAQVAGDLEESGPIVAVDDGQIIENVRITAVGEHGIDVSNLSNVIIRNVEILHEGAHGIQCSGAPGIIIRNVSIIHTGVQSPLPAIENNINCSYSDGLRVRNARLRGGSSGVWVFNSPHAHLSYIEGYDFLGPFPRGQLAQFDKSPYCILEDFSAINDPGIAWTEDNVSVYFSDNCVVRRGILDGNNSPSGVGVMFEDSANGLVEDVDTIRQGNGSFSAYPGWDITFRRTRARDNVCEDQGRGEPLSNALIWAGDPSSSGLRIEDSHYFNACNPTNIVWDSNSFDVIELSIEDFTPRDTIVNEFWWEAGGEPPPSPLGPITDTDVSVNEVAENASIGAPVGITAFAEDLDASDIVTYSLTASAGGLFAIDANSGVIAVAAALDAETETSHVVTVEAASSDGSMSSKDFTIDVIDVGSQTVTLQDLGSTNEGRTWFATVGVTVAGAGNVSISATWSWNGGTADGSCQTTTDSCLAVASPDLRKNTGSVTYTVDKLDGLPLVSPEQITLFKP